jgi:hypothetical protein
MGKEERIVVAFIGIIVAGIGAKLTFDYFAERGVQPDIAGAYAIVIFLAILGAFGLIAVSARL